jgi:phosphoribosyl-AMP cyclohydrolase
MFHAPKTASGKSSLFNPFILLTHFRILDVIMLVGIRALAHKKRQNKDNQRYFSHDKSSTSSQGAVSGAHRPQTSDQT